MGWRGGHGPDLGRLANQDEIIGLEHSSILA